ncbi:MAG: hypothetical protein FWF06_07385 [Symbiobacteriaceae bacterium]|nr:hypothetical protein [Symbiobacteriaceae bacterium]
MLKSLEETASLIKQGKLLHVAATEALLKQLPTGNWIGGTTEYFMCHTGGVVSGEFLFVNELPSEVFTIRSYDTIDIGGFTQEAYDNGFSLIVLPFDSEIHWHYARYAASFEDIFFKNVVGWVAGVNLGIPEQTPLAYDGRHGVAYRDKAVVLHVSLPAESLVNLGIINIFTRDASSPLFEFPEDTFTVTTCTIDGRKGLLADYLRENNIDIQLPLVGDYSGVGINISIKAVVDDVVHLYAPVFQGIEYHLAESIADYATEFRRQLEDFGDIQAVFSCNCILNFLYGELQGKEVGRFIGPITFGEVAYQLVNQTLVYVVVQ